MPISSHHGANEPMSRAVNLAVEGFTDEIVMRSILSYTGLGVSLLRKANGKPQLLQNLPKYIGLSLTHLPHP